MFALLQQVATRLDRAGIAYMLTGSMAMSFYVNPRATQDIDLVLELLPSNVDAFLQAFPANEFYIDSHDIKIQIGRKGMFNLIDLQTFARIDGIVRNDSPYEIVKFERRQQRELGGMFYSVISREDLIIAKIQWIQRLYSEKQMEDIRSLLAHKATDHAYLRHWAERLSLNIFNLWQ